MASEEELRRERELNELLSSRVGTTRETTDLIQDQTSAIQDQARALENDRSRRLEINNLTRQLNKVASDNYSITAGELGLLKTSQKLRKDRLQIDKVIYNLSRQIRSIEEVIKVVDEERAKLYGEIAQSLLVQSKNARILQRELEIIEITSNNILNNTTVDRFNKLSEKLKGFSIFRGYANAFSKASDAARESIVVNTQILETGKGLTKEKAEELGLTKKIEGVYGKVGLNIAKLSKKQKEILITTQARIAAEKESLKVMSDIALKAVGASLLSGLFKVNKAQTEFRRLTGQSVDTIDTLNTSLISTADYIRQASSATQEFGISATAIFTKESLQEAAELTNLMGLSAEEANSLLLATSAVGDSLDIAVENAIAQVNAVNAARTSAVSQKVVFQDIAKTSAGLTVAFGGQVDLLAEAAAEARALGLNLAQIEKIADGLLDIETSIKNEFVAQSVLGREVNLSLARQYAQTDNIKGLVEELRKNEGLIEGFIRGGKIEREAAADALNMQVDEMGKFILLNRKNLGISTEAALAASNVTETQLKQLEIQEAFNKSVEKVSTLLMGTVEPIMAAISNHAGVFYGLMTAVAGLSLIKLVASLASALRTVVAITSFINPAQVIKGLAVAAIGVGGITALLKGFDKVTETGDLDMSPNGGPIAYSPKLGGLFQGKPEDGMMFYKDRSNTRTSGEIILSDAQVNRIAAAIASGAEEGTSKAKLVLNIDGRKLADSQQVPSALGQYKFSS